MSAEKLAMFPLARERAGRKAERHLAALERSLGITEHQAAAWDEFARTFLRNAERVRDWHEDDRAPDTQDGAPPDSDGLDDIFGPGMAARAAAEELRGSGSRLFDVLSRRQRKLARSLLPGVCLPGGWSMED